MTSARPLDDPAGRRLDDLVLAVAARRDRSAFAALFNHFAPRVKSYLMRFGATPGEAEELAQEAMLLVWEKASYFDPQRAGASVWIFTIARNLRISQVRKDKRFMAREPDPSEAPDDPVPTDDLLLASERDEKVREALSLLSEEQAQIVQLSFFSEKPHAEIAQELGLPLGTVKSRIRRAMLRLRSHLEDLL